jgi:hypothetical protein
MESFGDHFKNSVSIIMCEYAESVFPFVVDICRREIAFDFQPRDALELAPINGSERMFIR